MHEESNRAEQGLTALLRQLGAESTTLIRSEITLAKMEAREIARTAAIEGAKVGAAVALAAVGGLALVAWLILVVGHLIGEHYATAAAIVGVVFLVIGAVLARKGMKGLRSNALEPAATLETLQQDKQWASREMREFKSSVSRKV